MPMQSDAVGVTPRNMRITVGLDRQSYDALVSLAGKEERSLSWLVAQAVKHFLASQGEEYQYLLHFDQPVAGPRR